MAIDNSWRSLEIADHHRLRQILPDEKPDITVLYAAIAGSNPVEIMQTRATEVNVVGTQQGAHFWHSIMRASFPCRANMCSKVTAAIIKKMMMLALTLIMARLNSRRGYQLLNKRLNMAFEYG